MKELFKNVYRLIFKEDLFTIIEYCLPVPIPPKIDNDKLYETALTFLGKDASPKDIATDEYGCMETVDTIFHACFGRYINPDALIPSISTYNTFKYLTSSNAFLKPTTPIAGDIIISPTGFGNGNLKNGHVGIVGKSNIIMSNNSNNGKWEENYTLTTWVARYQQVGGFPVAYFRKV